MPPGRASILLVLGLSAAGAREAAALRLGGARDVAAVAPTRHEHAGEPPRGLAAAPCPPAGLTAAGLESWRATDFRVRGDAERNRAALALLDCLGHADPGLRDGIAFEALSRWLRRRELTSATVVALAERLAATLDAEDDREGFRRPFAALVLSEVARADRLDPVLPEAQRARTAAVAARYLESVADYRGFDPVEGWRHGVAHGADLVLQLGLHPSASPEQVQRLLEALATQVAPRAAVFYTFGEPERLARAVFFIQRRGVLDDAFWDAWLARLAAPAPLESWARAYDSLAGLARRHNTLAFLHALAFAGHQAGDDAGTRLARLAERGIAVVMGG